LNGPSPSALSGPGRIDFGLSCPNIKAIKIEKTIDIRNRCLIITPHLLMRFPPQENQKKPFNIITP
jgi:hypothetical protein